MKYKIRILKNSPNDVQSYLLQKKRQFWSKIYKDALKESIQESDDLQE